MGPLIAGDNLVGSKRVQLHPEDAAKFAAEHKAALDADDQRRSEMFAAEMLRLDHIAKRKAEYDRMQRGPRDQQLSYDLATEELGIPAQRRPEPSFDTWATSQPETRSPLVHLISIPENFVYQSLDALSDQKPLPEIGDRLAKALPGAVFPEMGYPVEPGREHMYKELGPVGGLIAEFSMPGLDVAAGAKVLSSAGRRARNLYEAADAAWRGARRADLVDRNGDVIRRLRNTR